MTPLSVRLTYDRTPLSVRPIFDHDALCVRPDHNDDADMRKEHSPLRFFFEFSARLRIIFGELGLVGSGNEPHIIRVKTDDPLLKMGEKRV